MTPPPAEADYARRHVAIRWALTLAEPLLPPDTADSHRRDFAAQCETEPEWSRTLLAGIIADIGATLIEHDVWRSVSARAGDLTVGANPPEQTGATRADGQRFGTSADFDDLVEQQILGDMTLDLAFSPVARPATPEASAVIAFSFDGWQATSAALAEVADSGTAVYDIGTEATRWLTHRRRCHGLYDDTFVYECAWTWGWRADKVAADGDWVDSEEERDFAIRRLAESSVASTLEGRSEAP